MRSAFFSKKKMMGQRTQTNREVPKYNLLEAMGYLTYQASVAIRRRISAELVKKKCPITIEQFMALVYIWDEDGEPQWVLVEKLYRDKGAVARLAKGIESLGFIKRVPSKENNREKRLFMTKKGRALMDDITQLVQEIYTNVAEVGIDDRDLATCKDVLKQLRQNCNTL